MTIMTTRRRALAAAAAFGLLAACGNGVGSDGATRIDTAADASLNFLYGTTPAARELADKAAGVLVIPQVTQAGAGIGGSYGRGVLRIDDIPVDYYSATQGSVGLQIGAQQFSQAVFFMTDEALAEFRASTGWTAGAGVRYALETDAMSVGVDSNQLLQPIRAVVFAQSGMIAGATVEGTKYTRIIP